MKLTEKVESLLIPFKDFDISLDLDNFDIDLELDNFDIDLDLDSLDLSSLDQDLILEELDLSFYNLERGKKRVEVLEALAQLRAEEGEELINES